MNTTSSDAAVPGPMGVPLPLAEAQVAAASGGGAFSPMRRIAGIDQSAAFAADPYRCIGRQCRAAGAEAIEMRLRLQRTIGLTGCEAERLLAEPGWFERDPAWPEAMSMLSFALGSQAPEAESEPHRHARWWAALATPSRVAELARRVTDEWRHEATRWPVGGRVVLHLQAKRVLTKAVCAWAGVPLRPNEVLRRTGQLMALFDDLPLPGSRRRLRTHWQRRQALRWIGALVDAARSAAGALGVHAVVPSGSLSTENLAALEAVALHREADNRLPPTRVAAGILLDVMATCVAVAATVAHGANAMHLHPACRTALLRGESGAMNRFVREVCRLAPLFPVVAARVRRPFAWRGLQFPAGVRVLLELHDTRRDARAWDAPEAFSPDRFRQRSADRLPEVPWERLAQALTQASLRFLLGNVDYVVPAQDTGTDFSRVPAIPREGFVIQPTGLDG